MTTAKTEQLEQAVATLDALEESSIDLGQQQTQLSDNNTLIMKKSSGTDESESSGIQAEDEQAIQNLIDQKLALQTQHRESSKTTPRLDDLLGKIETIIKQDKSKRLSNIQGAIEAEIQLADNLRTEGGLTGFQWLENLIRDKKPQGLLPALFGASTNPKETLLAQLINKRVSLNAYIEADMRVLQGYQNDIVTLEKDKQQLTQNYEALAQIDKKFTEITKLQGRITTLKTEIARTQLADELKTLLTTYQTERNNRYQVKDKLASKDKISREQFVRHFNNTVLKTFILMGDSKAVLDHIKNNQNNYPGINFQTTLNKMIVTLADFERSVSELGASEEKVTSIIGALDTTVPAYAGKIKHLDNKIKGMKKYAATLPPSEAAVVRELATKLHQDLNYFICQHDNTLPTQEAFADFSMRFKARLHSQDDVMNKTHIWKFVVANVLAALTIIPLAIKLIHSKVTGEKRASFFFDKTAKESARDTVEKGLDGLKPPQGS